MAREIRGVSPSGTLYVRLLNAAGLWWTGATFEAYTAADYASYAVAMTQQGASAVYTADMPAGFAAGAYDYFVHHQLGGSAAEADPVIGSGSINWDGSEVVVPPVDDGAGMTGSDWHDYVLRGGFKRTDKDAELFEATTDAVQILRRRFAFSEAQVDKLSTDTITVPGDFKLALEADMGLLLGVVLEDGPNATPLIKVSKARYDQMYPDVNVTADRGYPIHYCVYAEQIYVGPVPDRPSFNYRLSYSKSAGAVTVATVGVPFTALYRDVLRSLTLSILYGSLEEYDKAGYYNGVFETSLQPVIRRERKNAGEAIFMTRLMDC